MIDSKALKRLNTKLDKIGKKLANVGSEIPGSVTRELVIGANDIRNTIITSMQRDKKTGLPYRRGKNIHIASAPGESPAVDFGELLRSIMFDVREMEVEVGNLAGAPYGGFLEEGTENMEPRPWLHPAVNEHFDDILSHVGKSALVVINKPFEGI